MGQAPPGQHIKQEGSQIGVHDLGTSTGEQGFAFVPEPPAGPRLDAACAAGTLVGGVLRHTFGDEGAHTRGRREACCAGKAGIYHDADALDGEAGLGDGGGQHHFA